MITQDLLNFIKSEKQKGVSDEEIKNMLQKNNWQDIDINLALQTANSQLNTFPPRNINSYIHPPIPNQNSKASNLKLLITVFLLIILIICVTFFQRKGFSLNDNNQPTPTPPTAQLQAARTLAMESIINWSTLTASEIGMHVKYPPTWKVEKKFVQYKLTEFIIAPNNPGIGLLSIVWNNHFDPVDCSKGTQKLINFAGELVNSCYSTISNKREFWDFMYSKNNDFSLIVGIAGCPAPCTTIPYPSIPQQNAQINAEDEQIAMKILKNVVLDMQLFDKTKWISYNGGVYSISYPPTWTLKKDPTNSSKIQLFDPNSTEQWYDIPDTTAMFVNILSQTSSQTPQQYVDNIISQPPYTKNQEDRITISNYKGFGYKPYDLKSANYTNVISNGNSLISITLPSASRENIIISKILSTFKFN